MPRVSGAGGLPDEVARAVASAERLVDRGRAALRRNKLGRAELWFALAVGRCPIPAALNNLALVLMEHDRNPRRALQVLAPNLEDGSNGADASTGHPFAHALASRCHHALGEPKAAARQLRLAVRAFERGPSPGYPGDTVAWREYTATILQAAGTVAGDRQVWELYGRWESRHVLPQSHYFGGVAAFNLGRFRAAARVWGRLDDPEWGFVVDFARVAELCQLGLVPPFKVPYEVPDFQRLRRRARAAARRRGRDAEILRALAHDPLNRVLVVSLLLGPPDRSAPPWPAHTGPACRQTWDEEARGALAQFVAAAGEWGEQLAHALFDSDLVGPEPKLAAARGLVQAGRLQLGAPVRMRLNGRRQEVMIQEFAVVVGNDPELDRRHREAIALRDAGRVAQAREILKQLACDGDRLWAPAAITYANLLRQEGNLSEARHYLELVKAVLPDDPVVLFNMASLNLQEGRLDEAWRYLRQVETDDPHIREKVEVLKAQLNRAKRRSPPRRRTRDHPRSPRAPQ